MFNKKIFNIVTVSLFFIYSIWWLLLLVFSPNHDSPFNDYFADSYGILSGVGGIIGLIISKKWGFLQSYMGKSLAYLSFGLICQFLGQVSYSIIFYVYNIENAYPSIGEIFYLASIPLYVLGVWNIAKASGIKLSLQKTKYKMVSILLPFLMILVSYHVFLINYDSQEVPFSVVLLDYIYPIGQAFFVSLALLTYFTTRSYLGGLMRGKIFFVLFALVFQYIADSMFIFETRSENWYAGGLSDLMFVVSYFIMTLGLIRFFSIDEEIKPAKQAV